MSAISRRATPASIAHHVDALPPGTRLAEFEVEALLGVGGFGLVYQAFDHQLQRLVAIKEYMPAALAGRADGHSLWVRSSSDEQSFQAGLASFVEEARLLARFDHPSLVKVLRFWEANQTAYMVMPLYRGMTLKQARAHMRTPPPEAWLRSLLWSMTSALHMLHDGQTLHRDISPDNIFLRDCGPPVLLDLGAARHAIGGSRDKHAAVLKVNYAPLEQYTDAAAHLQQGPWSDLYALGAMVHGCLCNNTPMPATQRAERDRMAPFARVARRVGRQFGVAYSRPFVAAIAQCLELQPQDRPQSVADFRRAMEMTAAPVGLEAFDFRAQLGAAWVEPQSANAQGVAVPVLNTEAMPESGSRSRPAQSLQPMAAPAGLAGMPPPARKRPLTLWAMAGAAALLCMIAGLWWGPQERPRRQTPESEIMTEMAEPAPAQPAQAAVPPPPLWEPAGTLAPPRRQGAALPEPAAMGMQIQYMDQAPAAPPPRAEPAGVPAVTIPGPPPAPVPARAPAPAPAPDPLQACAASSFLTRPMCIHQECRRSALAQHPVCVENRQRQEAQERQRQMYGQ